jgi:hypothetical protein
MSDLPIDRDTLGRMVREAWVRWAQTQPDPKPSWLQPYDELAEPDKEADRQIGEAIATWTVHRTIEKLTAENTKLLIDWDKQVEINSFMYDENDRLREALENIKQWSEAYPLNIFQEPDLNEAHRLLMAGGITLDAVSASTARHVVKGVGEIARNALK